MASPKAEGIIFQPFRWFTGRPFRLCRSFAGDSGCEGVPSRSLSGLGDRLVEGPFRGWSTDLSKVLAGLRGRSPLALPPFGLAVRRSFARGRLARGFPRAPFRGWSTDLSKVVAGLRGRSPSRSPLLDSRSELCSWPACEGVPSRSLSGLVDRLSRSWPFPPRAPPFWTRGPAGGVRDRAWLRGRSPPRAPPFWTRVLLEEFAIGLGCEGVPPSRSPLLTRGPAGGVRDRAWLRGRSPLALPPFDSRSCWRSSR